MPHATSSSLKESGICARSGGQQHILTRSQTRAQHSSEIYWGKNDHMNSLEHCQHCVGNKISNPPNMSKGCHLNDRCGLSISGYFPTEPKSPLLEQPPRRANRKPSKTASFSCANVPTTSYLDDLLE